LSSSKSNVTTTAIVPLSVADTNCFTCSKLNYFSPYFFCSEGKVIFYPIETPPCNYVCNDNKRKLLNGKALELYRLLGLINPLLIKSIPSYLLGAIGTLKNYNLVYIRRGVIRKKYMHSAHTFRSEEKFIYLNEKLVN